MNQKEIFYQELRNCNEEDLYPISDELSIPQLGEINKMFGVADSLSIQNADKFRLILKLLAVAGTLLVAFFLFYDEAEQHWLIFSCLTVIICLWAIRWWANNSMCHENYLEFRVLAESLRVQFFISVAGIEKNVADILPWFIKKGIIWIPEVLNELGNIQIDEKRPILDFWIRDQKSYHENALERAKNEKRKSELITNIILIVTVASYFIACCFELYILIYSPGDIGADFWRTILKIVLGLMSAGTLFIESYYGKLALDDKINDHFRMKELYIKAEQEVMDKGENEETILFLAREFLIENSTWYAYQNQNKPDLVF